MHPNTQPHISFLSTAPSHPITGTLSIKSSINIEREGKACCGWGERGGDLAVAKGVCCGEEKVVGSWVATCSQGWWIWGWRTWEGGGGL